MHYRDSHCSAIAVAARQGQCRGACPGLQRLTARRGKPLATAVRAAGPPQHTLRLYADNVALLPIFTEPQQLADL
ncbi:MAG: hypothetical protein ACRDRG_01520 [Pseudonocardiaceae bacterium]